MSISIELLSMFIEKFANRLDVWYQQRSNGGYCFMEPGVHEPGLLPYEPVSPGLIAKHLAGQVTIGFPCLDISGTGKGATVGQCKWCVWDFDDETGSAELIEQQLKRLGFNPLREAKRPGRAGHVWLLFDRPVFADKLIRFDLRLREALALPTHAQSGHEFFPKQSKSNGPGSQVRGPLGIHRKPKANGVRGLFEGAGQTTEEQLIWLSNQEPSSARKLDEIADLLFEQDRERTKFLFEPIRRARKDGKYPDFHILDYIKEKEQTRDRYLARCPLCAAAGKDKHGDNLHIALDGTWFGCWLGYWNTVHTATAIIKFLTRN